MTVATSGVERKRGDRQAFSFIIGHGSALPLLVIRGPESVRVHEAREAGEERVGRPFCNLGKWKSTSLVPRCSKAAMFGVYGHAETSQREYQLTGKLTGTRGAGVHEAESLQDVGATCTRVSKEQVMSGEEGHRRLTDVE